MNKAEGQRQKAKEDGGRRDTRRRRDESDRRDDGRSRDDESRAARRRDDGRRAAVRLLLLPFAFILSPSRMRGLAHLCVCAFVLLTWSLPWGLGERGARSPDAAS